jgi:hypothetical protein
VGVDIVEYFKQTLEICMSDLLSISITDVSATRSIASIKSESFDETDFKRNVFFKNAMMNKELIDVKLQYYAERLIAALGWNNLSIQDTMFLTQLVYGKEAVIYHKYKDLFDSTTKVDDLYAIFSHYEIKDDLMDRLEFKFFQQKDVYRYISTEFGRSSFTENIDLINRVFDNACIYCMSNYCDTNNYHKIDRVPFMTSNSGPAILNGFICGKYTGKDPSKVVIDFILGKLDYLNVY